MTRRTLVVTADDFGQSSGVNGGIVHAHEDGIVTSASLMVRHRAAIEAAAYARTNSRLGVGLHVDLGEWMYRAGAWVPVYEVVPLDDAAAVAEEIERQLERFHTLVRRPPTHLDSHQHVHGRPVVRTIFAQLVERLGIPVRGLTPTIQYRGEFYGQTADGAPLHTAITVERLVALLRTLPPGVTELGCHPAVAVDLVTMYGLERVEELKVLCNAGVRQAITELGIELRSFPEIRR